MTRTYYHLEYSYKDDWKDCHTERQHFKTKAELELFLDKLFARDDINIYYYNKSESKIWWKEKE